ncbi:MAG: hypothetical protein IPG51_18380 [Chloroflexi bacterium]|nr:hypothetical protein [Chloroflexota bacterium]
MSNNHFIIDKITGTFADDLLAAGFMAVLDNLYRRQVGIANMTQVDCGHYYQIMADAPLDLEKVQREAEFFIGARFLRTEGNKDKLPTGLPEAYFVDYKEKRDERNAFFDALNTLEKTVSKAYWRGDEEVLAYLPTPPDRHYDIYRMMNSPTTLIGYTRLVNQWVQVGESGRTGDVCYLLCQMFSSDADGRYQPNDVAAAVAAWKDIAKTEQWPLNDTITTASQVLNPAQGKGVNRPKPDGVSPTNLSGFWLLEWLKLVGFYQIGLTAVLRDSSDRKTYVPAAGRMTIRTREQIDIRFRNLTRANESATRADILTVLQYLRAFIRVTREAQEQPDMPQLRFSRHRSVRPADFIHGFHVAFYKNLGNAAAVMNMAFLNLPGWVQIHNADEAQQFLDILDEHAGIVRQFAENKGDELDLLGQYRDFVVADNLGPFFEFNTAYSSWLISAGEKPGFPPRKFSTHNLRRLLVSVQHDLSDIVESPGFINIARAIRESTVRAQYRKNQKNDKRYTVRYGLGRDLVRKAYHREEFVAALSEFLLTYNAENAQVLERYPKDKYPQYKYRWDVQTGDIKDILSLIDKYSNPPDLIAKLLVAYGYASDYQAKSEEEAE